MNEEMRESEQVLFGQQSVFERDNASLVVVSVAPRFKFSAKESVSCGTGAPVDRGQMSVRVCRASGGNQK